ncbi:hypothetical protein B0T18DRAFT_314850 [Schizothecium vesticola]|uniref:Oxidase ustYa n=1 Tax=Schizothecium vesticola TaxID=314040 RepID=A0AA40FC45_9PEZI|nr:hypothetical protein B0T18DRAFT_314850 [Schizothecium vesticola]
MGDEKHDHSWPQTPRSLRQKASSLFLTYRWLLDTSLLLVILVLVLHNRPTPPPQWEVGSDFTGVAPKFSHQITRFSPDQSYAPSDPSLFFTDPSVLARWNALMPKGMGFVWVNATHRYHDLPTPVDWPDKTVFTTSVTHQLHCLFAIVQTYSGLKSGHAIPADHDWHMTHCFDYMRQAILCSADVALEGRETTFPDDNGGSDGWDAKHVCRDYGQVRSYLEGVRAYDDQLIY